MKVQKVTPNLAAENLSTDMKLDDECPKTHIWAEKFICANFVTRSTYGSFDLVRLNHCGSAQPSLQIVWLHQARVLALEIP